MICQSTTATPTHIDPAHLGEMLKIAEYKAAYFENYGNIY
jgi:hypothetical protein